MKRMIWLSMLIGMVMVAAFPQELALAESDSGSLTSGSSETILPEDVILAETTYTYDGNSKRPAITIEGLTQAWNEGDPGDYTAKYTNNKNAGTATVTIKGQNDYSGTIVKYFTINPADIAGCAASVDPATWGDSPIAPSVVVDGVSESDYSVSYKNVDKAGTGTAVITGQGNYTGTLLLNFPIARMDIRCGYLKTYTNNRKVYTGKTLYPTVKLYGGLVKGKDFTVTGGKKVGTHQIKIRGIGNYCGTIEEIFTVVPSKPAISKITVGKGKMTVKMKKKVSTTGGVYYLIDYREKGKKKYHSFAGKSQSITVQHLKKGKRYQVRVRAYRKKGYITYRSAYTSVWTTGKVK